MAFHATQRRAIEALERLRSTQPELAARTEGFEDHYLHGGLEKPSAHMLHAAVCLLREPDFSRAASEMSREAQIHILQAEKHVIDAVNHGPDSLKHDEAFLHDKGIMRGSKRYFLGFKGIELGGLYDIAWRCMDPAYRPIIAAAVQGSMNQKDKVISKKTLQYVAACLMPEDDKKYLQLNKLSMKYDREHFSQLKEAGEFIRTNAKQLAIIVPENMLDGALTPKSQRAPAALPVPSSAPQSVPEQKVITPAAETPLRKDFRSTPALAPVSISRAAANDARPSEQGNPEMLLLKRQLERLEKRGDITSKAAKGYYWLHSGSEDEERSHAQLGEKIGKSERHTMFMMVNVKMKLKALEAEDVSRDSQASNGNLHQPRPVRPE